MKIIKKVELQNKFENTYDKGDYRYFWSAKTLTDELLTEIWTKLMDTEISEKQIVIDLIRHIEQQKKELAS